MKAKKPFAIYCSQGASRVVNFFSSEENKVEYPPKVVIYDGDRIDVIDKLRQCFAERLVVFDKHNLSDEGKKRIHSEVSQFIHHAMMLNRAEFLLCFGDKILKKSLINSYPNKLINFHPSILPSFKGLNAIDKALQYGVAMLGNTAHYIDEGIDTGSIIIQTVMLREDFKNYEDVLELQFPMIKIILRDLLGYEVMPNKLFEEIKQRKSKFIIPEFCSKL